MKHRYFFSIFLTFSASFLILVSSFLWYLYREYNDNIDKQITSWASSLITAYKQSIPLSDFSNYEEFITNNLDDDPPNQIITILDEKNASIYENDLNKILPDIIPPDLGWITINEKNHRIRSLTINLPNSKHKLQVAILLDHSDERLYKISHNIIIFSIIIFIFVALISYILTNRLLAPVKVLAEYLDHIAHNPDYQIQFSKIVNSRFILKSDEILQLIHSVKKISASIQEASKFQNNMLAHMAHEIKNSLTLIKNCMLQNEIPMAQKHMDHLNNLLQIQLELIQLNSTNSVVNTIHAIKSTQIISEDWFSLFSSDRDRIQISLPNDEFRIYCNQTILRQILINLIENAFKHSPEHSKIYVDLNSQFISVKNEFGLTKKTHGYGLGMQWVHSVCRRLEWPIEVQSNETGNYFEIKIFWN